MTDAFVKEQVRVIEEATKDALRSKETALRFLEEAGIIKKRKTHTVPSKNGKFTRKK